LRASNAASSTVAPDYVFLHLTKLTFNGKSYDIPLHQPKAKKAKENKQ
jgi:hypothetical protein